MSDLTNTDYSKFKEDPELLRMLLQNTVETIIADSCSLGPHLKKLMLTSSFTKTINQNIDNMWVEQNIANKLKVLLKVEKENPADFIAWRPTATDTIPETRFKGDYLTKQKQELLRLLEVKKARTAKLNDILISKENTFNKYRTKLLAYSDNVDTAEN